MTKEFGQPGGQAAGQGRHRSALVRALDARPVAVAQPVSLPRPPVPPRPAVRELSVMAALEWAFAVERVRLDFDDLRSEFDRPGCDTIWRLMQRGALGCQIDGGGVSPRHDDAEVIASMVAALPVGHGGRGMAAQIASLARSGASPDWMKDERPRCVPKAWSKHENQHGRRAKMEVIRVVETEHRGRKMKYPEVWCPVTYISTGAQIAAARRGYLDWWGALLHLQAEIRIYGLRTIRIAQDMPPMTPWRTTP